MEKSLSEVGVVIRWGWILRAVSWGGNASGKVETVGCLFGCLNGRRKMEGRRFEVWGLNGREGTGVFW